MCRLACSCSLACLLTFEAWSLVDSGYQFMGDFILMISSQVSVCPTCGGDGEVLSEYCRRCSGEGRVRVKKDIKVKIPPGVSKGSILRVAGEGDAGPRGCVCMLSNFKYPC